MDTKATAAIKVTAGMGFVSKGKRTPYVVITAHRNGDISYAVDSVKNTARYAPAKDIMRVSREGFDALSARFVESKAAKATRERVLRETREQRFAETADEHEEALLMNAVYDVANGRDPVAIFEGLRELMDNVKSTAFTAGRESGYEDGWFDCRDGGQYSR